MRLFPLLFSCLVAATASAAPLVVSHAGRVLDGSDAPVEGSTAMSFRIFELAAPENSVAPLWQASCNVDVMAGHYAVLLGDGCGTDLTTDVLPIGAPRYLEVSVQGTPLLPRLKFGVAPAAALAGDALNLGGRAAEEYALKTDKPAFEDVQGITDETAWPGTVPFARVTGAESSAWPGTLPFAQVSGVNADTAWPGKTSLARLDGANGEWPGTVPLPRVSGVEANTPWVGTVPFARVTGVNASTEWPGTVPAARVSDLAASIAASAPGVKVGSARPSSPIEGQLFFHTGNKTLELFADGNWVELVNPSPPRSCKDIVDRRLAAGRGFFNIDPDGLGPGESISVYCDLVTDGGGWTQVFRANSSNLSSGSIGYVAGVSGSDSVISRSSEMLFAFIDEATGALAQPWKFPTPQVFHSATPMSASGCGYVSIAATRLEDDAKVTQLLRYGSSSFSSQCDEGCSSSYGQICLKSNPTPGAPGGTADFPHYTAFNSATSDSCSRSDQSYSATACSASRRFVILVR